MRRGWLTTMAIFATVGCWTTRRPSRPATGVVAAEPSAEPAAPVTTPPPPPASEEEPPAGDPVSDVDRLVPSIVITQVSGASAAEVGGFFAEITERLEACGARPGDTIEIALLTSGGDVATRLRTSNADDAVNSCVLNNVAFDIDAVLPSSTTSPSERQSDVRSVLTIRFGR